jgi:NAD(P)-dependent dehydrogenase (short-subunit alcohol dehydrogenase family)
METPMNDRKVALVTGVSSGIGRSIAVELAQAGFRVFGTVRSAGTELPAGIEPVVLDVRDDASVAAAVSGVRARAGRIDALVNNAGASVIGAIEETDIAQAQALFDVNFFGAVRVTQAVLPIMREQRAGRIAFISSIVGHLPAPFMGFYAASKHAVEGYAESLDHEVRGLGIRTILIEPGFMKTKIDQNAQRAAHQIGDYGAVRERVSVGINSAVEHGDDPAVVAGAVRRALTAPRPRLRYPVGKRVGTFLALRSFLPASLFDRSFRRQFHLD